MMVTGWYNRRKYRKERLDMEEMFNEMMVKYQDIRRNGKILVDIQVPQVNSRIMNIKAEDGTIWYCRMMDGKVYDLVDMDTLEKMPRICEYREED